MQTHHHSFLFNLNSGIFLVFLNGMIKNISYVQYVLSFENYSTPSHTKIVQLKKENCKTTARHVNCQNRVNTVLHELNTKTIMLTGQQNNNNKLLLK